MEIVNKQIHTDLFFLHTSANLITFGYKSFGYRTQFFVEKFLSPDGPSNACSEHKKLVTQVLKSSLGQSPIQIELQYWQFNHLETRWLGSVAIPLQSNKRLQKKSTKLLLQRVQNHQPTQHLCHVTVWENVSIWTEPLQAQGKQPGLRSRYQTRSQQTLGWRDDMP